MERTNSSEARKPIAPSMRKNARHAMKLYLQWRVAALVVSHRAMPIARSTPRSMGGGAKVARPCRRTGPHTPRASPAPGPTPRRTRRRSSSAARRASRCGSGSRSRSSPAQTAPCCRRTGRSATTSGGPPPHCRSVRAWCAGARARTTGVRGWPRKAAGTYEATLQWHMRRGRSRACVSRTRTAHAHSSSSNSSSSRPLTAGSM
jgi:hypothetical protein